MSLSARLAAAVLALLTCLSMTSMLKPERLGGEHLQVRAEVEERENGLLELHLAWEWEGIRRLAFLSGREEYLAVSFDTRTLLFESEEASYGVGVSGESLRLLERVAGFNGARRFYVAPWGWTGEATVLLRPTCRENGGDQRIRVHTVVDPGQGEAAVREMVIMAPELAGGGTRRPRSEI